MSRLVPGSLRFRLIFLTILVSLPLLGLILYNDYHQREDARAAAEQDALRLIRIAALEQGQLIRSTKQLLLALAQLPEVHRIDPLECQNLFNDLLAQYPFYSGISVANPTGDVICSSPPVSSPVTFADRLWFQRVLESKDLVISDYQLGRISGKSVIVIGYPIFGAGQDINAVLAIGLDLSWINQLINQAELPANSAYTVLDRNGIILARYPDPEKWIGQPMADAPIVNEILTRNGEGTLEAMGLDGIPRLYTFSPLSAEQVPGAYVAIGIPKSVAYAEANQILLTNMVGLGLVMLFALVAAWLGGHVFIINWVRALVRATNQLQAGDLGARTGMPYRSGELGQLGQAFDTMAEALQERDLEVRQSNTDLRRANRALHVISACNQALIRAEEESDLLSEICQIILKIGGYRLAWVGLAQQDQGKTVLPVAQAGYEEGYLKAVEITWADSERGRGPTGTAIRTGKPVIAKDILSDPDYAPWREEALKRGYHSSIALPLNMDTQPIGALNIYAAETDAFDDEEVTLLEELAGDVAFGIVTLRMRAQRLDAEERVQRQLKNMAALRNIDLAITASLDLRVILNVLLDQIASILNVDAACVLLLHPQTLMLEFTAGRGFRTKALQHTHLKFGEGNAGRAAFERQIVAIHHLDEDHTGFERSRLFSEEKFVTYFAVPLIAKNNVKGVLEIFHRAAFEPDREWQDLLESLAMQAAIAIDNASLFDSLQISNIELMRAYDTTLEGWSRALDLRDKETEGHTKRVTEITLRLARAMGVTKEDLVHIQRGAMLHDIGKMGIPDSILLKPGPLTDGEWEIMRRHPTYAYELLSPIAYLRSAVDIPYCHHEKWDGSGYPRGLKGDQIPLAARIFAIVDVWDALRSDRPYRKAWTDEDALIYLKEQAGTQFDPQVVEGFIGILDEKDAQILIANKS